MTTKTILTPNGTTVEEMTAEELEQRETEKAEAEAKAIEDVEAKQAQADLKASAKAKLIAGEALTEDEANTIVL
jgi:hypothetical protein